MHAERQLPTEIAPDGYQALRAVEGMRYVPAS